jgi:predicted DNA-binding transcriptional regulator AlpA
MERSAELPALSVDAASFRSHPNRSGRSLATIEEAKEQFLPAPLVAARYHVSDMTIYSWLKDERMQFPQPHYFGRFRYWKLSDLAAWERDRATARLRNTRQIT